MFWRPYLLILVLATTVLSATAASRPRILILRFENQSHLNNESWLQEIIADQYSTKLGRIHGLEVIDKTQIREQLKKHDHLRHKSLRLSTAVKLGRSVNADYLLLGSYQFGPDDLTYGRSIISIAQNEVIDNIYHTVTNAQLLALLHKDIARVANVVKAQISDAEARNIGSALAVPLAAYRSFLYLRGDGQKQLKAERYQKTLQLLAQTHPNYIALQLFVANLALQNGKIAAAETAIAQLIELSKAQNDLHSQATGLLLAARVAKQKDNFTDMIAKLQQSRDIATEIDDSALLAASNYYLGHSAYLSSDYSSAESLWVEAEKHFSTLNNRPKQVECLNMLATVAEKQAEYKRGLYYLNRSIKTQGSEQTATLARTFIHAALMLYTYKKQRADETISLLEKALLIASEIQSTSIMFDSYRHLGRFYSQQRQLGRATEYWQKAEQMAVTQNNVLGQVQVLSAIAKNHYAQNHYTLALETATKGIKMLQTIPTVHKLLASLHLTQGRSYYRKELRQQAIDATSKALKYAQLDGDAKTIEMISSYLSRIRKLN